MAAPDLPIPEDKLVYRLCKQEEVEAMRKEGAYSGTAVDIRDSFIHMSALDTVRKSAELYYNKVENLKLLVVDVATCGEQLKWDYAPSRGCLFPHYYSDDLKLPESKVKEVLDIPLNAETGLHDFPKEFP